MNIKILSEFDKISEKLLDAAEMAKVLDHKALMKKLHDATKMLKEIKAKVEKEIPC